MGGNVDDSTGRPKSIPRVTAGGGGGRTTLFLLPKSRVKARILTLGAVQISLASPACCTDVGSRGFEVGVLLAYLLVLLLRHGSGPQGLEQ